MISDRTIRRRKNIIKIYEGYYPDVVLSLEEGERVKALMVLPLGTPSTCKLNKKWIWKDGVEVFKGLSSGFVGGLVHITNRGKYALDLVYRLITAAEVADGD